MTAQPPRSGTMLALRAAMHARLLLPLSCLAITASCARPEPIPHDDVLPGGHSQLESPELPRLASGPLPDVTHGSGLRGAKVAPLVGPRRITQSILLLAATGEEPSYLSAKAALERLGVPHRTLIATTEALSAAMLTDDVSRCHFSGVIVATSGLGFWNATTAAWESALSPQEWQDLAAFELACSARELVWYGWPSAAFGLEATGEFGVDSAVDGTLSPEGKARFLRVRDTATIPYRHSYGYHARIMDPAATTPLVVTAAGSVLLARHVAPDGREVMVSTVDSSPYLTHAILLEHDLVRWVTRELFVGKRRAYLTAQIDDIFLDNEMWVVGEGNRGTTSFRISGGDLSAFVAWQRARRATLPAGSSFITEMAFNGAGTQTAQYPDSSLVLAARLAGSQLTWLNHTWDHDSMDGMSQAAAAQEVSRNCSLARQMSLHGFRCADLVTPDVSGLGTPAALAGMYEAGVRYVVSDTSITEAIRPGNPGTNPSFNVGRPNPIHAGIYQVPRHPTSIFYDVSTPAAETDEYNTIYRAYWGRDLTYDEILDKDSEFGLFYLLQGDIDPLMFHQANLAAYDANRSLYADWVDAVLAKYLALTDAPIQSLGLAETGAAMKQRGRLDACGLAVTIVESSGPRTLEIAATNACTVPITGLAATSAGSVEMYAGEPTTSIVMAAGQRRSITLP